MPPKHVTDIAIGYRHDPPLKPMLTLPEMIVGFENHIADLRLELTGLRLSRQWFRSLPQSDITAAWLETNQRRRKHILSFLYLALHTLRQLEQALDKVGTLQQAA